MKISFKKAGTIIISAAALTVCVILLSAFPAQKPSPVQRSQSSAESSVAGEFSISSTSDKSGGFMSAVWVPFMSLDLSGTDRSEAAARKRLEDIFDRVKQAGADTVFLHVHPFCDALYKSSLFPSSHLLSGKQGQEPGYDFLKIAAELAKKRSLHIHAWVNPLRVTYSKTPSALSADNPYNKWKNDNNSANDRWCFKSSGNIYLNPAYPEVRRLITDGIREIVRNYDIDGVVIDDYFYPDGDFDADKTEYELYTSSAGDTYLSQSNWRKQNINSLVSSFYSAVHYEKPGCVFGISPQCNMENDERLAADIRSWCSISGYCDYISPQTYVSMAHPVLPFEKSVREWKKLVTNKSIRLYISLALYKEGTDADSGTWQEDEIRKQISYCKKAGTDGYVLFSSENLK